jgi:hypothetical protein
MNLDGSKCIKKLKDKKNKLAEWRKIRMDLWDGSKRYSNPIKNNKSDREAMKNKRLNKIIIMK